jgi:hypothetical protein
MVQLVYSNSATRYYYLHLPDLASHSACSSITLKKGFRLYSRFFQPSYPSEVMPLDAAVYLRGIPKDSVSRVLRRQPLWFFSRNFPIAYSAFLA